MGANVVAISIYCNNQRVKLTPDSEGKFLIPNLSKSPGSIPLVRVTAKQLIYNKKIKYMDPVLTLDDGTKLRVFQGGDPTGLLTIPISLIEKHDNKFKKKKVLKKKAILDYPQQENPYYPDWDWPDQDWE